MSELIVTKTDMEAGLRDLGMQAGDTVLAHSSLKSFGYVEGGANSVIDALLSVAGPSGCVVVPTLTLGSSESPVVFDVQESPSTSGLVTNVFRKRSEAYRSHHPTSSAAAIGWGAKEMTAHHTDTPCGLTSPYGQVYLRGGWCLFLGAKWGSNTMFHVAEEIVMPEYLRFAEFRDAVLVDEDGIRSTVAFRRYNCYQTGVKRDLSKMGPIFEAAGVVRHAHIGASQCMAIRAEDVIEISVDLLRKRPEEIFWYQE